MNKRIQKTVYFEFGKYIGDVKSIISKEKHGKGVIQFKNGDRFKGIFVNNEKNGKGIYYYKNGDVFEGNYEKNKRINGIFRQNGSSYTVEYKDGKITKKRFFDEIKLEYKSCIKECEKKEDNSVSKSKKEIFFNPPMFNDNLNTNDDDEINLSRDIIKEKKKQMKIWEMLLECKEKLFDKEKRELNSVISDLKNQLCQATIRENNLREEIRKLKNVKK